MKSKIRARPAVQAGAPATIATSLSLVSSLVTAGILSFFVDTLRRAYKSVPLPIILVMSASCLNVTSLLTTTLIRCFFPSSVNFQLLFQIPIAVFWTVTAALLGRELGDHLMRACPSAGAFGHDLFLTCHLFKTLFAFTIVSTASSYLLVFLGISDWRYTRKAGEYTAMLKNMGGPVAHTIGPERKRTKLGMLTGMLRKRKENTQEDERSIMMKNLHLKEKHDGVQSPGASTAAPPFHQSTGPSPESITQNRTRVDDLQN